VGGSSRFLAAAALMTMILAHPACADPALPPTSAEDNEAPDAQPTSDSLVEDEPAAPTAAESADFCVFVDMNGNVLDYGDATQFLLQGAQSRLSADHVADIRSQIGVLDRSIVSVGTIFAWKHRRFATESAGGEYVGKLSVDEIMQRGALTGCHDHGLILVSVLREYGFPSVMVDAAGIDWALDHAAGAAEGFSGHVFVEVLTDEGWILTDSTSGQYLIDYEPCEPVIPLPKDIEPKGYYVLLKGRDPDDYGVVSIDDLKGFMRAFAEKAPNTDFRAPACDVRQLSR